MIKKLLSVFISVAIAFTVTAAYSADAGSLTASAEGVNLYYYYDQMSDEAQYVYDTIKEAVLECKSRVKIRASVSQADFEKIAELLILHDPETFNVYDITASSVTRTSAIFNIVYSYNKSSYDKMMEACRERAEEIIDTFPEDAGTYKKLRIIHDELINSVDYDVQAKNSSNIYGVLVERVGKCDGYAKAFAYVCARAGIRTVTVIGEGEKDSSIEMHMWNKVRFNNKWYNIDVTWDDPVSNLKSNLKHDFFMISDEEIKTSHTEDNLSFAVPEANDDSINYYKVNKKYAESFESAKSIMTKGLTSAAKKGDVIYDFRCSSEEVFNSVKKFILDTDKMAGLLKTVKKNSGSDIIPDIFSYSFNEKLYTVKVLMFYDGTGIDDYFSEDIPLTDDMIKTLNLFGIK